MNEINDYYTRIKPKLDRFAPDTVSTAVSGRSTSFFSQLLIKGYGWCIIFRRNCPWFFVPFLFATVLGEIILVKLILLFRKKRDTFHTQAKAYVDEMASQYPFGTYAVVWKSMQLERLHDMVAPFKDKVIVEAAVGEGTFSRRVFDSDFNVTGLDINPISLRKAADYTHIKYGVVCDCMNPPLIPQSADLLISNNFLHHVTNKKGVLQNWSKAATTIIFNDCSPNWSEALPMSYVCNLVGLSGLAKKLARTVDNLGSQYLIPRVELDEIVKEALDVQEVDASFSPFTYCLANVTSLVFLHMGPVPAEIRDAMAGTIFEKWAVSVTATLSRLLLDLDQTADRGPGDVLVIYKCKTKEPDATAQRSAHPQLRCFCSQDAHVSMEGICGTCGKTYPTKDGMLFVLPESLEGIVESYDPQLAAAFPKEHL